MTTNRSGAPLPDPIGTSAPFFVIGLCGNTGIQIFPPLFVYLVITLLADSICLAVTSAVDSALSPNVPKFKALPV